MAEVYSTVIAVGLSGGVGLAGDEPPVGQQGEALVAGLVLVLEVAISQGQVLIPGGPHGVIELDGALGEGDHDGDPVAAVHVDGYAELVQLEEVSLGGHVAGPSSDKLDTVSMYVYLRLWLSLLTYSVVIQ